MHCAYSSISCPAGEDVPWESGGDIAAVVETLGAVRVLVGDVMGHGPKARHTAAEVSHAFGQFAAHEEDPPEMIAARLDQLVVNLDRREEFVTAQLIDIPRGCSGGEPQIVCCGHPPPLLLSDGRATFLDVIPPAPPLGLLGLAGHARPSPSPLGARAGDTVLLYTDGVTEARDRSGVPYPFPGRAAAIARDLAETLDEAPAGAELVGALKIDLFTHADGALRDDATLMCLQLADEPSDSRPQQEQASGYSNVQYS